MGKENAQKRLTGSGRNYLFGIQRQFLRVFATLWLCGRGGREKGEAAKREGGAGCFYISMRGVCHRGVCLGIANKTQGWLELLAPGLQEGLIVIGRDGASHERHHSQNHKWCRPVLRGLCH